MRILFPFLAGAIVCLGAQAAVASTQSRTLYRNKDWQVRQVTWDDGTSQCVAEISYPGGDAFSIWEGKTNRVRLQFYSPDWSFGSKDSYAAIELRVDNQNPWRVSHADFYKNSVFIDPPSDNSTSQFISEIESGNSLYLYDDKGRKQNNYSLAGSQASIQALNSCRSGLH